MSRQINWENTKCFCCAVINGEDRKDHYWGVALVNYNRKGGSTTDRGFYLNYCPECGRKIADKRGEE